MAAVLLERSDRCSTCGSAAWEWLEDPEAWTAVEEVCMGCAMRDRLRESRDMERKGGQTARVPGASIRLVRSVVATARASMKAERPKSARERARESVR